MKDFGYMQRKSHSLGTVAWTVAAACFLQAVTASSSQEKTYRCHELLHSIFKPNLPKPQNSERRPFPFSKFKGSDGGSRRAWVGLVWSSNGVCSSRVFPWSCGGSDSKMVKGIKKSKV